VTSSTNQVRASAPPVLPDKKDTRLMKRNQVVWLFVAIAITLLGVASSFVGSHNVARNSEQSSRHVFEATSADVVSTLSLDIKREQDLVVAMASYFTTFPTANQHDFELWTSSLTALKRYPELSGVAEVVLVKNSQLSNFESSALKNPAGSLGPHHTFQVTPSGTRPYYCFAKVALTRPGTAGLPAGFDYCATPLRSLFMKARSTGVGAYLPFGSGATQELVVGTPLYKTALTPTSPPARRAAFLGWAGTELLPHVLLSTIIKDHPHTLVKLQYHSGGTLATFQAGSVPKGAQVSSADLHNGWSVRTYALVNSGTITSNMDALALLLIGVALSLLLGAMIFFLGTSRTRAMSLVKERTTDLEHLALHDVLTGLPNRALILDRTSQMIARVKRDHTKGALLFIDLDNFKDINDTLGHNVGDQLLIAVGLRLSGLLRGGDTVGRLGGDEFVILAEGDSLYPDSGALASRLLSALAEPFKVKDCDVTLSVSASIGIAQGVRDRPEDLLKDADIAMYRAKSSGKSCAVDFLPSMQEDVVAKRELNIDLQRALENNEFFLMYQPIVDLKSGTMTGVEALLRWNHPTRGIIQPNDFIPTLEFSGLIIPVGLWVLQEACQQGAEWLAGGYPLNLSVNISAKQLEFDQVVSDVQATLTNSGFPPEMLTLELTETTLMVDVEETMARLHLLKALGLSLAIDDFGTGYSSIAYLRQFPVDVIKIDRSFVSNIIDTAEAATLVHTLIQLGKDLGLKSVAEGVETDAQRSRLLTEDTDSAQGFLFARPLLPADVTNLVHKNDLSLPDQEPPVLSL
jgi:diguanylate cyclase (GGDEF)-like protein